MSFTCKGVCNRHEAKRMSPGDSYYGDGAAYCKPCQTFIRGNLVKCPCCNCTLSRRRSNQTSRKRLRPRRN